MEHLSGIDRATWSLATTPVESADRPFLGRGIELSDVLVAVLDGAPVGYVTLGSTTLLASNDHVLAIKGLAVAPACQRCGVGRQLLAGVIEEARLRGARRLRLRVLATNHPARELYASSGFQVEGILRNEFRLAGRYVDDVMMAIWIGPSLARP